MKPGSVWESVSSFGGRKPCSLRCADLDQWVHFYNLFLCIGNTLAHCFERDTHATDSSRASEIRPHGKVKILWKAIQLAAAESEYRLCFKEAHRWRWLVFVLGASRNTMAILWRACATSQSRRPRRKAQSKHCAAQASVMSQWAHVPYVTTLFACVLDTVAVQHKKKLFELAQQDKCSYK